ncbi:MAG: sel1 repeat family protein [Methylococcales bacterium]|nr:MAG: sel1 repeat family protein [Methylococcales bacterium]
MSVIKPITVILVFMLLLTACKDQDPFTNQPETDTATPMTSEDAIEKLQRAAQAGDSDAQYHLAYLYENGLGVTKDEAKALELYQQAADQGHPTAQNNLDTLKTH